MSIANKVQSARTLFETLMDGALERLNSGGLESVFAREYAGQDGQAITITMGGANPAFEAWEDEAHFGSLREHSVSMPFARQKAGLSLSRAEVVYDQTGTVEQKLSSFTANVGYLFEKLVIAKLASNPTGIDGVSLLNDSHPFAQSGGTWDNSVSTALSFDAVKVGKAAMASLKDEYGEPLDLSPNVLLVHPDEERTAREIAQADDRPISVGTAGAINTVGIGATGVTNVYRGAMDVIVSPRWTSGDWLLCDTRYAPIALGVWRRPEAIVSDDMSSELRQRQDKFLYAIESDVNTCGLQPYGVYGKIA